MTLENTCNHNGCVAEPLATLRVSGADAEAFLNAQLTRAVPAQEGEPVLAAWCDAKGRVLALFELRRAADSYQLRLPAGLAPAISQRLKLYVLRAKVVVEQSGEQAPESADAENRRRLAAVRAGRPQIYPATQALFLPQMLNLHRLDALDFRKGCFPGQEVIARLQHRGRLKQQLYRLALEGPAPAPGTPVETREGQTAGTVVEAAATGDRGAELLAVLRTTAADTPLTVHGDALRLLELPYATDGS